MVGHVAAANVGCVSKVGWVSDHGTVNSPPGGWSIGDTAAEALNPEFTHFREGRKWVLLWLLQFGASMRTADE